MKRHSISTVWRSITLMVMIYLTAMLAGCMDPTVADMEAQREEIGFKIERDLQLYRNGPQLYSRAVTMPVAQPADMEAERRELDRMVQEGLWRNLAPVPPSSQTGTFHPAP
jgi:hypothetical protein